MSETHFLGKVAQKAIIEKDGKVLLIRNVEKRGVWELPGGRLNMNEVPEEGLKREIKEEIGVAIEVREIVYLERLDPPQTDPHLFLVYHATLSGAAEFVLQPDEIAEVKWIEKDELDDQELFPMYLRALKTYFGL